MQRCYKAFIFALFTLIVLPLGARAQANNTFILQSPNLAQAQAACQTYGMTMVSTIRTPDTYLVQVSASVDPKRLAEMIEDDSNVSSLELNKSVRQTKHQDGSTAPVLQSVPSNTAVNDSTLASLFGMTTWAAYVQQPAMYSTNVYSAGIQQGSTGQGIIAVIDTGVDEQNPVLASVVIPGYDFTHNTAGYANDNRDLDQSTAHILHQSTAHILHGFNNYQLNAFNAAILDADTAAALQGVTLPSEYGHGTMVAGLIHLVAPTAKIMPLKAFNADGTSTESNIILAIYYAADHGANVINMSFGLPNISDSLMKAINYASRKGVVCVASVGNDGTTALVYPAAFGNVIGVASVDSSDQPSAFTNSGSDMTAIAAPGENLVTTYPGPHYASVSGTSFSSALIAGAADVLMFQSTSVKHSTSAQFTEPDVIRALRHAVPCGIDGSLGGGCFDMNQAVAYIQSMVVPPTATASSGKTK